MANRMRQLPSLSEAIADEDSSSGYEYQPAPRRIDKIMKSGMDRTVWGYTTVINKVTWCHEIVYNSDGKPTSYRDTSVP